MSSAARPLLLSLCLVAGCQSGGPSVETAVARALALAAKPAVQTQALSRFGEELHLRPPTPEAAERHSAALEQSLAMLGDDLQPWVWAGRQLAYLGRYRAAADHFSIALELFGDDPELLRHRGHRHITLRRFATAERDLERAWELVAGEPDTVEPDGLPNESGISRSTLKTNVLYHLALARYLQGDFAGAAEAWETCLDISPNDDMRVAAAYWLVNSLRRDGRAAEVARAIAFIRPRMDVLENDSYHRLLLHFRGELETAGVLGDVVEGTVASPTVGYGLAQELLHQGDNGGARAALVRVTQGEVWAAFGFIAAEADLSRR